MADPAAIIREALTDPTRLLGLVERNVEAKLISPALELLGWHPARQVLWGPQVRRVMADRRQDVEADAFVADITDGILRFVVEAKRWTRPLDRKAVDQTLAYLADVGAHRALLTNGHRWLVLDAGSRDPLGSHTVGAVTIGGQAAADLVANLAPYLSPAAAPSSPLPPLGAATAGFADVSALADDDPLVGELVAGFRAIAAAHPDVVFVDAGPKGLLLRAANTNRVIAPINAVDPLKPDLYAMELGTCQAH